MSELKLKYLGKIAGRTAIQNEITKEIYRVAIVDVEGSKHVSINNHNFFLQSTNTKKQKSETNGPMISPMPGKIIKINVSKGDKVKKGDLLLVMEAMKMEHSIKANRDGNVEDVAVKLGQQVNANAELIKIN
jgi:biotin carboxyl carrier protein